MIRVDRTTPLVTVPKSKHDLRAIAEKRHWLMSTLQARVDGVNAMPRRLDAVDVAVREYTCLVNVQRQFRDGVVTHRSK